MTAAITPGPWEITEEGEIYSEAGAFIGTVALAHHFPCVENERREQAERECPANANAIAAVPAMVEALTRCEMVLTEGSDLHADVVETLKLAGVEV